MEWMTSKDAAARWNVTTRQVQLLCDQGRIEGTKKLGNMWIIPQDAQKPIDGRTKAGRVLASKSNNGNY